MRGMALSGEWLLFLKKGDNQKEVPGILELRSWFDDLVSWWIIRSRWSKYETEGSVIFLKQIHQTCMLLACTNPNTRHTHTLTHTLAIMQDTFMLAKIQLQEWHAPSKCKYNLRLQVQIYHTGNFFDLKASWLSRCVRQKPPKTETLRCTNKIQWSQAISYPKLCLLWAGT